MKKAIFVFSIFLVMLFFNGCMKKQFLYKNKNAQVEERVEDLLSRMTLEEKIEQLSGEGFDTRVNKRLGIPALKMSDGPAGVRWVAATAFPAPVAMAATWNYDLVYRIGSVIGKEMRAKSRNFFLGPCVNILRHPLGGRNFESFGEDPFLASQTAVPYIRGVQDQGVLACVKHFVCNNQEWNRTKVDVKIDERALREIYFPAFRAAVQKAGVYTIMTAYNKFRGDWCSESNYLLNTILKNEWGFKGFAVSDWGATHSTDKASFSGLDLEMPWGEFFSDSLLAAVKKGMVPEPVIDDKVRRLLRVRFESGIFDRGIEKKSDLSNTEFKKHADTALKAAEESIVLLQNRDSILPLDLSKIKTLAVIGPNAAYARTGGGGSAQVVPPYGISILEGIRNFAGNKIKIVYCPGTAAKGDVLSLESKYLMKNDSSGEKAWHSEYFNNLNLEGKPVLIRNDKTINFVWGYDAPHPALHRPDDRNIFSVRWRGKLKAPATGEYKFNIIKNGKVRLFVNNKKIIDKWEAISSGIVSGSVKLKKDDVVNLKVEYAFSGGISQITVGWQVPGLDLIKESVLLAEKADAVIFCSGLSNRFESESFDRKTMELPNQTELIKKLSEVNKNIVVVNQTGSPVDMHNWTGPARAIVQAWYPGQEGGKAVANVLFGKINPSGKLPCSFIKSQKDSPAFSGYMSPDLTAEYGEGIFTGYRYLDAEHIKPVFPFGHGLSYTQFKYAGLQVKKLQDNSCRVMLKVKNTGTREGAEVVQIYVKDVVSSEPRPEKELKGFKKVFLKPGQEKDIEIDIDARSFEFFSSKAKKWVLEPGEFVVMVGSSSEDIRLSSRIKL